MKMKKGFLSLAVILCMLFCWAAVPVSAANTVSRGKCGESLSWALDSYGSLTISGTGDMYDYRDMTDEYDGDPSGIFSPWYESLSSIKTVVIESGASSIGAFAFEMCENLSSVTIPDGVTAIGEGAFALCTSLESVIIPDSVTAVRDAAFYGCTALTSVTLSKNITTVYMSTFYECKSLASIVIPDHVDTIGSAAFYGCTALTSVTLPVDLNSIETAAFYGCIGLSDLYYGGSESDLYSIDVYNGNEPLDHVNIVYTGHVESHRSAISVTVNGEEISFEQPPIIENKRTLVPMRAIFEALGASVSWHNAERKVEASLGGIVVELFIGSNTMYVNGTAILLDVPAKIVNDRTLVPIRAISESLGCHVDWDGSSQTVIITK